MPFTTSVAYATDVDQDQAAQNLQPDHVYFVETLQKKATINSLPTDSDFQRSWVKSLLKALWEKEKMLVTSIFSFSHHVFYSALNK